jgi:hypothetical protein
MKTAISMAGLTGRNRGQPARGQPGGSKPAGSKPAGSQPVLHDAGSGSRKQVAP